MSIVWRYFFILTLKNLDFFFRMCYDTVTDCERIKPVEMLVQRSSGWCEGLEYNRELHSGVSALKYSRCGRSDTL